MACGTYAGAVELLGDALGTVLGAAEDDRRA